MRNKRPRLHRLIIQRMQALGYKVNKDGMCFGISAMTTQAMLLEDFDHFNERLDFLRKTDRWSNKTFRQELNQAKRRRIRLLKYGSMNKHEVAALRNDIKQKKNQGQSLSDEEKYLLNSIPSERGKPLTEDQKLLLEMPAFFDGIQLYMMPNLYPTLFPDNQGPNRQDIPQTSPLVMSIGLEKIIVNGTTTVRPDSEASPEAAAGQQPHHTNADTVAGCETPLLSILESRGFSGVYSQAELDDYLWMLDKTLSQLHIDFSVVIHLHSSEHIITIGYNASQKSPWSYMDSNQLDNKKLRKYDLNILNSMGLAELIVNGLGRGVEPIIFRTSLTACTSPEKLNLLEHEFHKNLMADSIAGLSFVERLAFQAECYLVESGWKDRLDNIVTHEKALARDYAGSTWLWLAAHYGDLPTLRELLIDHGADVNQANNDGYTPLFIAVQHGHVDAMQLLIDHGADVNQARNNGRTPLITAAQKGHVDAMVLLIECGADVNQARNNGRTPLITAAQKGHVDAMQLLIEHGADVNQARDNGDTPLIIAVYFGHFGAVNELLRCGANPLLDNKDDQTALYMAAHYGHLDIVQTLLKHQSMTILGVNSGPDNGATPLYVAARRGHFDIVITLLAHGAKALLSCQDMTAAQVAYQQGHYTISHVISLMDSGLITTQEIRDIVETAGSIQGCASFFAALKNAGVGQHLIRHGHTAMKLFEHINQQENLDITALTELHIVNIAMHHLQPPVHSMGFFATKCSLSVPISSLSSISPRIPPHNA